METVSPNIFVNDIQATIEYYQGLGFSQVASVKDDDGNLVFAMMVNGTATFMFQTFRSIENQLPAVSRTDGGSLLLYVKMKGIREYFEKIKDRVKLLTGLEHTFYGATEFSILDVNNYMLTFAEDD